MVIAIITFVGSYLYALNSKLEGVSDRQIERQQNRQATPTYTIYDWKGDNDD